MSLKFEKKMFILLRKIKKRAGKGIVPCNVMVLFLANVLACG